jgi:hypothetical protein
MLDAMSSNYATGSTRRADFLDYLRTVQEKDPERLPDRDISTALLTNLSVTRKMLRTSADVRKQICRE